MKIFQVSIKGTTSLLQHRFGEQAEGEAGATTRNVLVNRGSPREEAQKVVYQNGKGEFYFPGAAIARMTREAGGAHKMKGTRKSAKYVIPAAVLVMGDEVIILNGDGQTPAKSFEVDSRPVTIPATKGRVMRHRPRFDDWSAKFKLRINETLLPPEFINKLLGEGGQQIGIGDYRPEKGGPFGTFILISSTSAKQGKAGRGHAWRGRPGLGSARLGGVRQGRARRCTAWPGEERQGMGFFNDREPAGRA